MDATRSAGGSVGQPPDQRGAGVVAVQPPPLRPRPLLPWEQSVGDPMMEANCLCCGATEQQAVAGGLCGCASECDVQNGWAPFICPCLTYERLKREHGLHGCLGRVQAINLLVFGLLTAISYLCWAAPPSHMSLLEKSVSLASGRGPESTWWRNLARLCYFGSSALTGLLVYSLRKAYYRKLNLKPFGAQLFFWTSMCCQPCALAQMARHAWPMSARQEHAVPVPAQAEVGTGIAGDRGGGGARVTCVLECGSGKPATVQV